MQQEIINIGGEPGNIGDGDTLRDAFKKTKNNFDTLFVNQIISDSSLSDHSDATKPGTIAHALSLANANEGGTIIIGPGTFNCLSTLFFKTNIKFVGSSLSMTKINAQHDENVIEIGTGTPGIVARCNIDSITIHMPDTSPSNGIKGRAREAGKGYIKNIDITGGSAISWGIKMDSCNEFTVSEYKYTGAGSGIAWLNEENWPVNYGDSSITSTDIILKNPDTTGVLLQGNTSGIINNIFLNRIEVRSKSVKSGTTGIKLNLTSRITLTHVDVENMDTAIINGPISKTCSFISVYALGCNKDYTEISPAPNTTIIGGYGFFLENQKLGYRKLELYDPALNDTTFTKTGLNDIEAYTDTVNPKILTLKDSGSTIFTNSGATDTVSFVLPNAAQSKSMDFSFSVLENQELRVYPNNSTDHIRGYDGTLDYTPDGSFIYSSTIGTTGTIHNVNNTWWIMDKRLGNWISND